MSAHMVVVTYESFQLQIKENRVSWGWLLGAGVSWSLRENLGNYKLEKKCFNGITWH